MHSARLLTFTVLVTLLMTVIPAPAVVPDAAAAVAVPSSLSVEAETWDPNLDERPIEVGGPPPSDVDWDTDVHSEDADDSAPFTPAVARAGSPTPTVNEGMGSTGSYSFHTFPMTADSNDLSIGVNIGTGNLYIRARIADLPSAGVPATLYQIYNSNNDLPGDLGNWRTDFDNIGLNTAGAPIYYDGTGVRAPFTQDGSSWKSGPGINATLSQLVDGTWKLVYNRTGEYLTFSSNGWVTGRFDRNGEGISYGYNGTYMTSITDATGKSLAIEYLPSTSIVDTVFDSTGRQYPMGVNILDNTLVASPQQYQMTYEAQNHRRLSSFAFGGRTLAFEYDSNNRVTQVTQSSANDSITTSFSYVTGETVIQAQGEDSLFAIDELWRVTSTSDQLGRTRSKEWTPNSDVQSATDGFAAGGSGNQTIATYDALNNQTSVTMPTGAATQAIYAQGVSCVGAQQGNPYLAKCIIDSAGNNTGLQYDSAGNLTTETANSGASSAVLAQYQYELPDGSLCGGITGQVCTSTDGNGHSTSYQYTNGNLVEVDAPAPLGSTTYTYDAIGRTTSVTDGNGAVTTYAYDTSDRLTSTTYNGGSSVVTIYNIDDTVRSRTDNRTNTTIRYKYNLLGQQTEKKVETPAGTGVSATVSMGYDGAGNLTSYADGNGTVTYAYDVANQLLSIKEPGGSCPTSGPPAPNSKCITFSYNTNGAETSRVFPGGARQDTTYDVSGRTTSIAAKDASGITQVSIGCSYAAAGSPNADRSEIQTRTSTKEEGIPIGAVTTYGYDSRNRLTSAVERNGTAVNASWSYIYDNVGNRTSQTRVGNTSAVAGTVAYAYNAANQLTSTSSDTTTWTYDGAGNQTRNGITGATSAYGDRLDLATTADRTYANFGQGNSEQLRAGATQFLTSALGLAQQTTGAATLSFVRDSDGGLIGYKATANHYFVADQLGSVIGMFSSTGVYQGGYSYSPYGETRAVGTNPGVTANTQRYIGGYLENSTIYKLGARYYDTTTGRFTQYDPSGQESHPYAYAENDPANKMDPSGLSVTGTLAKIVDMAFLGYSVNSLFSTSTLAGFVGGFAFGVACSALIGAVTAGAGVLITAVLCNVAGEALGNAIDDSIK